MHNWTRKVLIGAGLIGATLAAGCAYDDGYHDRGGRYDDGYYDRDHNYDRDRDDQSRRVRVCDDDGYNCHWEYPRH